MNSLWWLAIKLGGTKNLDFLSQVGELKYLELWLVRGLEDLSPVGEITSLQYLHLESLKQVVSLPSFRKLPDLRRINIQNLGSVQDLSPLKEAARLEELWVTEMPHLALKNFECLLEHPSLNSIGVALGSLKKNEAVIRLLGLPSVTWGKDFAFD